MSLKINPRPPHLSLCCYDMLRRVLNGFRNIMNTENSHVFLSKSELQAMSHKQLLAYALSHACSDRNQPPSCAQTPTAPNVQGQKRHRPINPDAKMGKDVVPKNAPVRKKSRKEFDMSNYGQRMIALKLNYQGWRFHGFSAQVTTENTVEGHLFAALLRTRLIESRESCFYSRAGRTDVGVSAAGQVIGIRVRSGVVAPSRQKKELDYIKILNSALPDGIRVTAWSPVCDGDSTFPAVYAGDPPAIRSYWTKLSDDISRCNDPLKESEVVRRPGERFSARFDALARSYRYFFARGDLDLAAMARAAKFFVGRHDFRNFCRIDENVDNFERVLYEVDICRVSDDQKVEVSDWRCQQGTSYEMFYIFVRGQAFLWHQVRCMAAVLFDVGLQNEKPEIVKRMLNDATNGSGDFCRGRPHYRVASPTPLVFWECEFPQKIVWFDGCVDYTEEDGEKPCPMRSVTRANAHITECWAESAAKREILGAMLSRQSYSQKAILIGVDGGRHVPYVARAHDPPLSMRRERAMKTKLAAQ